MESFKDSIRTLVIEASTNLPPDIRKGLLGAMGAEPPESQSAFALRTIALNVDMAGDRKAPICQDTGLPTFEIKAPKGADQAAMRKAIDEAVAEATKQGALRPNSVDSLTGKNSGNNLGPGTPVVHFEQWDNEDIEVRLVLKGGGSENMSTQYSVPCEIPGLGAIERNLDGVRKCVLHAVHTAQGQGCSVGVLGVAIGGDRANGYHLAKLQLMRPLEDVNPDPGLAKLEAEIVKEANALKIGTLGFGGNVTALGCKIGAFNRLPACYFVTIAYGCWALRRSSAILDGKTGAIKKYLHREEPGSRLSKDKSLKLTGKEKKMTTPISEKDARSLKVGDVVLLSGDIHMGRDSLHTHLMTHDSPVDLKGSAIYHCGPVALKQPDGKWTMNAAGPTTSIREEPYEHEIIRKFGLRMVIGKGGMGQKTLAALKQHGAVYASAIGGAGQYYAECIKEVTGVDFIEFGVPEAMWHIKVKDFPAVVTMDSHGRSLHEDVEKTSAKEMGRFAEPVKL